MNPYTQSGKNELDGMTLGRKLRAYRMRKNIGLRELALIIGKSPSWLSKVERDMEIPGADVLREICAKIGFNYDDALYLLGSYDAIGEAMLRLDTHVRKGQLYKGVTIVMTYFGGYHCEFEDYSGKLARSNASTGILSAIEEAEKFLEETFAVKRLVKGY